MSCGTGSAGGRCRRATRQPSPAGGGTGSGPRPASGPGVEAGPGRPRPAGKRETSELVMDGTFIEAKKGGRRRAVRHPDPALADGDPVRQGRVRLPVHRRDRRRLGPPAHVVAGPEPGGTLVLSQTGGHYVDKEGAGHGRARNVGWMLGRPEHPVRNSRAFSRPVRPRRRFARGLAAGVAHIGRGRGASGPVPGGPLLNRATKAARSSGDRLASSPSRRAIRCKPECKPTARPSRSPGSSGSAKLWSLLGVQEVGTATRKPVFELRRTPFRGVLLFHGRTLRWTW
jgi:hypothetical protein